MATDVNFEVEQREVAKLSRKDIEQVMEKYVSESGYKIADNGRPTKFIIDKVNGKLIGAEIMVERLPVVRGNSQAANDS